MLNFVVMQLYNIPALQSTVPANEVSYNIIINFVLCCKEHIIYSTGYCLERE